MVLVAMLLLHSYLWWRLVRSTTRPGRLRRRLTLLTVGVALLPVGAALGGNLLPLAWAAPLEWSGFVWLGLAFYLFLLLLLLEPVRLAGWLLRRRGRSEAGSAGVARAEREAELAGVAAGGAPAVRRGGGAPAPPGEVSAGETAAPGDAAPGNAVSEDAAPGGSTAPGSREVPDPSRRLFLARGIALTAGAVAVGTVGTGIVVAQSPPRVARMPVTIPRLDPAFDGFRIVTFGDTHLSSTYRGRRFERVVEMVNAERPDVVAIVGDLVDASVEELREDVAPLADLVSEQGVYFVTGNHEYFVETLPWMRHLPTLGVDVLRNERVPIRRGGASFDLAGIDDRIAAGSGVPGHGADLDAALDGRDDDLPVVLLAHQPVQVEQARAAGVDLQLSGHTHGGQLWPFDYAISLDQPAVDGLVRIGDTQLFVTNGAGYWGPPMRIGARPEIAVLELRAGG